MKKLFLIIPALLLASVSLIAQTSVSASDKEATTKATDATIKMDTPPDKISIGVSKVKFKETIHDFGNVPQNIPAECVFEFTNIGTEAISITEAIKSCGCTTPTYDSEPIAPGKTSKITAAYNSASAGNFTKTITVKFSNGDTEILTIKGFVDAAPVPAAPVAPPVLVAPN
jgi:hypothetical protein